MINNTFLLRCAIFWCQQVDYKKHLSADEGAYECTQVQWHVL